MSRERKSKSQEELSWQVKMLTEDSFRRRREPEIVKMSEEKKPKRFKRRYLSTSNPLVDELAQSHIKRLRITTDNPYEDKLAHHSCTKSNIDENLNETILSLLEELLSDVEVIVSHGIDLRKDESPLLHIQALKGNDEVSNPSNTIDICQYDYTFLHIKQYPDMFFLTVYKSDTDLSSANWVQFCKGQEGYEDILLSLEKREIPIELSSIFENYSDIVEVNAHVILKKEVMSNTDDVEPCPVEFISFNPAIDVFALLKKLENEIPNETNTFPLEAALCLLSSKEEETRNELKKQNENEESEEESEEGQNKIKLIEELSESEIESMLASDICIPEPLKTAGVELLDFRNFYSSHNSYFESDPLSSERRSSITPEVEQKKTHLKTPFKYITSSSQDIEKDDFLNFIGHGKAVDSSFASSNIETEHVVSSSDESEEECT